MSYQAQHAAARAAIRDTILGQTMPVELLVDALLLPAQPYLPQEAAWAFEQVGRGIIFLDELPLVQDQDQVTGVAAAADLGMFTQLGAAFHQAVVQAVAADDPATQYVTAASAVMDASIWVPGAMTAALCGLPVTKAGLPCSDH
jgi:hypothetical protein